MGSIECTFGTYRTGSARLVYNNNFLAQRTFEFTGNYAGYLISGSTGAPGDDNSDRFGGSPRSVVFHFHITIAPCGH